jgi:hypothetical protein
MYRVFFFCRSRPNEGWQGKEVTQDLQSAKNWAILLQMGTKGQAIVMDDAGNVVFVVG